MICKSCGAKLVRELDLSADQAWCGKWWRCPKGHTSLLKPSKELKAHLAEQKKASQTNKGVK